MAMEIQRGQVFTFDIQKKTQGSVLWLTGFL